MARDHDLNGNIIFQGVVPLSDLETVRRRPRMDGGDLPIIQDVGRGAMGGYYGGPVPYGSRYGLYPGEVMREDIVPDSVSQHRVHEAEPVAFVEHIVAIDGDVIDTQHHNAGGYRHDIIY